MLHSNYAQLRQWIPYITSWTSGEIWSGDRSWLHYDLNAPDQATLAACQQLGSDSSSFGSKLAMFSSSVALPGGVAPPALVAALAVEDWTDSAALHGACLWGATELSGLMLAKGAVANATHALCGCRKRML